MATFYTYKTKNGQKRYRFKVYLGTDSVTGKRIETSRRGFKTKKEAQIALNKLQLAFEENKYKEKTKNYSVNDVFELWYETYKNTVKETTAHHRYNMFVNTFGDNIGKLNIKKLTPRYMQKFINDYSKQLYAYREKTKILNQIFNYAVKQDIIEQNPLNKITYPKPRTELRRKDNFDGENFYTKDELIKFLTTLEKDRNKQLYVLCRLLAFSGMRVSEALALTWEDIDFNTKEVTINKTLAVDVINKKTVVNTPKTENSVRTISLDDNTLDILKKWKEISHHPDLIFTKYNGGYVRYTSAGGQLRTFFGNHPELKMITLHGFRHTHASLLFESGANIKDVQARLGHKNIQTTMNIYTHLTKDRKKKSADIFAKYMDI